MDTQNRPPPRYRKLCCPSCGVLLGVGQVAMTGDCSSDVAVKNAHIGTMGELDADGEDGSVCDDCTANERGKNRG